VVEVDIMVRSMGPISEVDMVRAQIQIVIVGLHVLARSQPFLPPTLMRILIDLLI
jgi:hypothetical protein